MLIAFVVLLMVTFSGLVLLSALMRFRPMIALIALAPLSWLALGVAAPL